MLFHLFFDDCVPFTTNKDFYLHGVRVFYDDYAHKLASRYDSWNMLLAFHSVVVYALCGECSSEYNCLIANAYIMRGSVRERETI